MMDVEKMLSDKQFKVNSVDGYSYRSGVSDACCEARKEIHDRINVLQVKVDVTRFDETRVAGETSIAALRWVLANCL